MCWKPSSSTDKAVLDSTVFRLPSMREMVGETVGARQVRRVNLACDVFTVLVGVALMVTAVSLIIMTHNTYAGASKMIPIYTCLGVLGFTGTILTILSIKWMIESCRKHNAFHSDVEEVT